MYVYLPKFNKQMHYYDPYRSAMGIFVDSKYYFEVFVLAQNMTPIWK